MDDLSPWLKSFMLFAWTTAILYNKSWNMCSISISFSWCIAMQLINIIKLLCSCCVLTFVSHLHLFHFLTWHNFSQCLLHISILLSLPTYLMCSSLYNNISLCRRHIKEKKEKNKTLESKNNHTRLLIMLTSSTFHAKYLLFFPPVKIQTATYAYCFRSMGSALTYLFLFLMT